MPTHSGSTTNYAVGLLMDEIVRLDALQPGEDGFILKEKRANECRDVVQLVQARVPGNPDLTAEEYNIVMDALMARLCTAPLGFEFNRIIRITDSVKDKFGRHSDNYREI